MINDPIVQSRHTMANAYEIQAVPVLISYLHVTTSFPAKETWLRAVEANFYSSWPGISLPRVRRHLTEPEPTTFGHLKLIRKIIRSTQPKPVPPPTIPRSTVHNIDVNVVDTKDLASNPELKNLIASNPELKNLIATDLPVRYPIISARGHKYIFVMYDFDTNYINAIPITSRKSCELVRGFTECYDSLKNNSLPTRLLHLDNEVSHEFIATIDQNRLAYQLASPGDHRLNEAERAIF